MVTAHERLLNLPRTFCALCAAAAAAYVAFTATTPVGDSAATVAQMERAVTAADGILAPHAFDLKGAQAPAPASTARTLYRMSGARGELLFLEGPPGVDRGEAERIFAELYGAGRERYIPADSALSAVTTLTSQLVPENRTVARAMALRQLQSKPRALSEQAWRERYPDSLRPWTIEEPGTLQLRRVTYAVGAAFTAFAVTILVFAIVRAARGVRSRGLSRGVGAGRGRTASDADYPTRGSDAVN
jgi:hypothetical protein